MNHDQGDNMSNNNKMPEGWGQNKSIPDSWGNNNKLPDNWGKQSKTINTNNTDILSSASADRPDISNDFSDAARAGFKTLLGTARGIGNAAKNAAGSAVEYAKSDDAKEKINAVKNKAKSAASVAECAITDIKEKTSDKITELRQSRSEASLPEHNASDDIIEDINSEVKNSGSEYQEIPDFPTQPEVQERTADEITPAILTADPEAVKEEPLPHRETKFNAISRSPTDPAPVYAERQYESPANDQAEIYSYKEKRSPVIYVLSGIIAVLLAGGGILGGLLLMKNKADKSERTESSESETQVQPANENAASSSDEDTSVVSTETTTPSDSGAETATEVQTSPAITGNKLKFYPSDKINDYPVYLEKLRDLQNNGIYREQNNGFFLCDINDDNIPELFATFNTKDQDILFAGSIYSGELVPFAEFMGAGPLRGITLFDNGAIGITSTGNEGHGVSYITYGGGNSLYEQNNGYESISYIYENGALSYISYQNGSQEKHITEEEAEQIQKKYVKAAYTAAPISSVIDTAKLPDDSKYIGEGYVITESTDLNMRSEPNSNSKVIASIPKNTKIDCYESGTNGWYIAYYKGETGYVSSEFVSIGSDGSSTVINGVTVYSCSKSGRINTHGGNLPSITLDYITGGDWKTLRDSLGNGWHIKAERYCNSKGITWYEIVDADDGDYYGWIDGEFIDFD